MRPGVFDAVVRFRVNERLIAQAEAKARRQGMTRSELIRQALRREVLEDA
jgi:antitoxin component of RelBE/YafQ-DinJ toxin-antitoxin module